MRRIPWAAVVLAALLPFAPAGAPPAWAQPAGQVRETPAVLPEGPGREVTFYVCTPCHSTAVIQRSGLTRPQWDDLMDWMVQRQGMPALNPELRRTVVDYLAQAFPPRRATPRAGRNPFAE